MSLKFLAACDDYKFGPKCTKSCRCRDKKEACDKETGRCRSGCETGWSGEDCYRGKTEIKLITEDNLVVNNQN